MKTKIWPAGLLTVALSATLMPAAFAQSNFQQDSYVQPNPTIRSNAPCPLSGQVAQTSACPAKCAKCAGWNTKQKTLVLQRGYGQFSVKQRIGIGPWDRLVMTLINPTDLPLKFETTQRTGVEKSWVVPAHSERCVSMHYTKLFSDEVKFLVTEEPSHALARVGEAQCTAWQQCNRREAVVPPAPIVQPPPQTTFIVPVPPKRSTIRGFW